MKAQAAQIAIQSIQTKIQTLCENADVYIEINGQQGYNKMLAGLVTRMSQMGKEAVREMKTPVSVVYSLASEQFANQDMKDICPHIHMAYGQIDIGPRW